MSFKVATNLIASWLPEHQPTRTLTDCVNCIKDTVAWCDYKTYYKYKWQFFLLKDILLYKDSFYNLEEGFYCKSADQLHYYSSRGIQTSCEHLEINIFEQFHIHISRNTGWCFIIFFLDTYFQKSLSSIDMNKKYFSVY